MKKKADALTNRLRSLLKDIKAAKEKVGKDMSGASFAISEAVWAAGDFRRKVSVWGLQCMGGVGLVLYGFLLPP